MKNIFKKVNTQFPTTWTPDLLKTFQEYINYHPTGTLCFDVMEKDTYTDFKSNVETSFSYRGIMPNPGFGAVYFALSSINLALDKNHEYKDSVGYIEIVDGIIEDGYHLPMIRGFIKDIRFFQSVNIMLLESKIFNSKKFLTLNINIGWNFGNIPVEEILNNKIPINHIDIRQELACYDSDIRNKKSSIGYNK